MKRMAGIVAVLLATAFPAPASEPERDPQQTERVVQRFEEVAGRLSLTPQQAEQLRALLSGVLSSMKAVRDYGVGVGNPSRRSRRRMAREIRAIQAHADGRLKLILSNAQIRELKRI